MATFLCGIVYLKPRAGTDYRRAGGSHAMFVYPTGWMNSGGMIYTFTSSSGSSFGALADRFATAARHLSQQGTKPRQSGTEVGARQEQGNGEKNGTGRAREQSNSPRAALKTSRRGVVETEKRDVLML